MSAVQDLAALRQRRAELQAAVHDIDRRLTFASDRELAARQQLTAAERQRLNGSGSAEAVTRAERALVKARQAATADASPEKLAGARAALRDLDGVIGAFAREHYAELRAEHEAQAVAVAAAVDAALAELVAAYGHRQRVDQEGSELWQLVAQPRQRLTPESNAQRAVVEAEAALAAGPDPAPLLPPSFLPEQAELVEEGSVT
jgi:hypothetical protein